MYVFKLTSGYIKMVLISKNHLFIYIYGKQWAQITTDL